MCLLGWGAPSSFSATSKSETQFLTEAAGLVKRNRLSAAETLLREGCAAFPVSARLHGELGKVLLQRDQFQEAVEEYGQAAQLEPDSWPYNMGVAEALIGWGHYSVALDFLQAVELKFRKYAEFHYYRGLAFYGQKQIREALGELEITVRMNPKLDQAQFLLAGCRASMGDLAGATASFRSLTQQFPTRPTYWMGLCQTLQSRGEEHYPEALQACRRSLRLKPGDLGFEFKTATLLMKLGKYAEARPLLEHIVKVKPKEPPAHVALATVYSRLGEKELARREAELIRALETSGAATPPATASSPLQ
ncbi:MAG: tetratricopeptide repeat protein [Acidobacteria bacterium]|nr:tetratricopeptide repeat protein [Acidobacteriota bacterium]